jgi:hypothetical protein
MPVHKQRIEDRRRVDARFSELKRRLIAEWKGLPGEGIAPDIIEERNAKEQVTNVYVIWDDWADLDAHSRAEMVFDAFENHYGQKPAMDLAIAMGLTKAEAKRAGVTVPKKAASKASSRR